MDEWGVDVVMTASQKGLGTPPGLSVLVASKRAIQVRFPVKFLLANCRQPEQAFENRVAPVSSYYASWKK